MTRGNRNRLEKAATELQNIALSQQSAQEMTLALFRVIELIGLVCTDLVLRPKINSE